MRIRWGDLATDCAEEGVENGGGTDDGCNPVTGNLKFPMSTVQPRHDDVLLRDLPVLVCLSGGTHGTCDTLINLVKT